MPTEPRGLRDLPRVRVLVLLGFACLAALLVRFALLDIGDTARGYHGHGYCFLWQPGLVYTHALSDALIALSYIAISATLVYFVVHTRSGLPYSWIFVAFGTFIVACGLTHVMDVWTLWTPRFWLAAEVKIVTAIASVATAIALPPLVPRVLRLFDEARLSERRRIALELAQTDLERRVTERTEALDASLRRERGLRIQAEAASRAREDFLAIVSHELRTPLNAILGWSELLQVSSSDADRAQKGLQAISRNARAQAKVVDDLIEMSRMITGRLTVALEPVALVDAADAALEAIRPVVVGRGQDLHLRRDDDRVKVSADPARLQQVLWNLLSNASKFTPAGGRIDVRVTRDGSMGVIAVEDTGIGIDQAFLPHVFERFSQADTSATRPYPGLGLGLAIVRYLVELHGGRVTVASAGLGSGATFTVILPALDEEEPTDGVVAG